jgi:hypothetical protein
MAEGTGSPVVLEEGVGLLGSQRLLLGKATEEGADTTVVLDPV